MNLPTFVEEIKRRNKFGDFTVTSYATDQPTIDIINALNNRMQRFWRAHPWDWDAQAINQSFSANVSDVILGSNIGRILSLKIDGQSRRLEPISFIYYHEWKTTASTETGVPGYYVRIGRSSNNLKIKLVPTPVDGGTLIGWGQGRITTYAASDVAANTGIAYFPTEVHDILLAGVEADILQIMGKTAESDDKNKWFETQIAMLIAEEQKNKPDEVPRSYVPDYYRRRVAIRGKGTGVV